VNLRQHPESLVERYSRQLVIPDFGAAGQDKLSRATVLVVGTGGLGSPVAYYLAAAGVGTLGLVDDDVVSLSNLQRQILHRTADIGRPKVESAARSLAELNPSVRVIKHELRIDAASAGALVGGYDVVVSAVDNLDARYVLNDACLAARKPLVEAGVMRWEGMITTLVPGETGCYRCLFPRRATEGTLMTPAQAGIVGAVAGLAGTIQATEVLKLLLGLGETLAGRLLVFDAMRMSFQVINIGRNPKCEGCGSLHG
jgi:adenylyltransferase/sulfurtransferase